MCVLSLESEPCIQILSFMTAMKTSWTTLSAINLPLPLPLLESHPSRIEQGPIQLPSAGGEGSL